MKAILISLILIPLVISVSCVVAGPPTQTQSLAVAPTVTSLPSQTATAEAPRLSAFQATIAAQAFQTLYPKAPTLPVRQCTPTDQDNRVYDPSRLRLRADCIRVTGTVKNTSIDPDDGDGLINLMVDEPFAQYLVPANSAFGVALHLEIVCYRVLTDLRSDVKQACKDNLTGMDYRRDPLPKSGDRIWAEGRWVLDVGHEGWAELHPLYRWGKAD